MSETPATPLPYQPSDEDRKLLGEVEAKRQQWREYDKYIGRMLTVKYQKMTATEEPVPFQPVAKGFVKDDEKS